METVAYNVKLYANDGAPELPAYVPVFHQWIKTERPAESSEIYVDVADYAHVENGPGILLVGHYAHYAIDELDGRPGLLFSRKRAAEPADARSLLKDAFRRALVAARELEGESDLSGLSFRTDEVWVRIVDRLHAPNVPATYEVVEPLLREITDLLYDAEVTFERENEPRRPFGIRVRAPSTRSVDELLQRLG